MMENYLKMCSRCIQTDMTSQIPFVQTTLYTHLGKWKRSLAPEGLDRGSQPFERLVAAVVGDRRAFRYATSSCQSRVPKGTLFPSIVYYPAIEMAGYHCLMPMASFRSEMCIKISKLEGGAERERTDVAPARG